MTDKHYMLNRNTEERHQQHASGGSWDLPGQEQLRSALERQLNQRDCFPLGAMY